MQVCFELVGVRLDQRKKYLSSASFRNFSPDRQVVEVDSGAVVTPREVREHTDALALAVPEQCGHRVHERALLVPSVPLYYMPVQATICSNKIRCWSIVLLLKYVKFELASIVSVKQK